MRPSENEESDRLTAAILTVAHRLVRSFELSEVLQELVDEGRAVLHAEGASVLLLDRERQELYSEATADGQEIRFPADQGIAGRTLVERRVLRIDNCYADPDFNPAMDRKTGFQSRCMISAPLIGVDTEVVGVMQVINSRHGRFTAADERLAQIFSGFAALAIQQVQAFADRERTVKLERDLDIARDMQLKLLPDEPAAGPGYQLEVFSQPAEETGGDIYDLIPLESLDGAAASLLILLADATGHGVGAAISVTQVRSMLRMAVRLDAPLDALCRHLNDQLVEDLPSSKFVTGFLGIFDPERHRIEYRSLGQAPLLVFHASDRRCESLAASGLPMGMFASGPLSKPRPISLEPGDVFVLLSDGFYEWEDPNGEMFGEDRVCAVIDAHREGSAREILTELCTAVERFSRGTPQEDDLTAVVLKRLRP